MYTYRKIFSQALKIAWRNPGLWFFGFFVYLLGSTGEMELLFSSLGFGGQQILLSFWEGLSGGGFFSFDGIKSFFSLNPLAIFGMAFLFLVVLGLTVLVVWLTAVSQSAVISQVIQISKNKAATWRENFQVGLVKFWPVLGLNVLLRAVAWILFTAFGLLALVQFPGSALLSIIIFDIFLVVVMIASFVVKYAVCGVVLKNWQFKDSISKAWQIFLANWMLSIEVAILLLLIFLVLNATLVFFTSVLIFYSLALFADFLIGLIILFLFLLGAFLVGQIVLALFHWAVWAIVFELLTSPKQVLTSRVKSGFRNLTN